MQTIMFNVGMIVFVVHSSKGRLLITPAKIVELVKRETEAGISITYNIVINNKAQKQDYMQITDTDINSGNVTLYTDIIEMKKVLMTNAENRINNGIRDACDKAKTEFSYDDHQLENEEFKCHEV